MSAAPPRTVTIVADRFDEERGGREGYLAALARFLTAAGHTVELVHARPGESVTGLEPPVLAAVPVLGASHVQLHSGILREAFAAERESFPSALRRGLFWPALRLNRARSALLAAEERLFREPGRARFMAFSEALRGRLVEQFGLDPATVTVDRPGADRERFRPAPAPTRGVGAEHGLRLLFVAHSFELKGLRTAMRALALAPRAVAPSLTVVGRGAVARFRGLAMRLGVAGRVRFTGPLAPAAVAELYRRHDALVHPTFYDPFPLVVAEAMASGLPVVTTRRCGAAEVIPEGEAGFLIDDPRDASALLEALRRLCDPVRRGAMASAAIAAAAPLSRREHLERVRRWLGLAGGPAAGS